MSKLGVLPLVVLALVGLELSACGGGGGAITVVGVTQDGAPVELIPVGQGIHPALPERPSYNPDFPALPPTRFDEFVTFELVVEGGTGPYTMRLEEFGLPDRSLPLSVAVIDASTSLAGAPVQEAPNAGAFLLAFEITDARGQKGYFTCRWLVYSTPIVLDDAYVMPDGQVGVEYGPTSLAFDGGVPPYAFEFVTEMDGDVRVSATDYPVSGSAIDAGPEYDVLNPGVPPEGLYVEEDTGVMRGVPRRRGDFMVFCRVFSQLLPNSPLQNRWSEQDISIAPAPEVEHDPTYALDPAFANAAPYARIRDAERDTAYGLQLLAGGGCPDDGYTDAPHASERVLDPDEKPGDGLGFRWTVDWDPDSEGNLPIAHMELLDTGIFQSVSGEEADLSSQPYQSLAFTATDRALPASTRKSKSEKVRFSIGPDRVIVTQSATSYTESTGYDNRRLNDTAMTVMVMLRGASTTDFRAPDDTDLTGDGSFKHDLPPEAQTTSIATLLSTLDLCRVSVNPTGWWDDTNHLNPRAARPFQHSDSNGVYAYYRSLGYAGTTSYLGSSSSAHQYQIQPQATCVRLPRCTSASVTDDESQGVYTSGGKLHVFDSSDYFGILIIREDGRLYVPAAFHKSSSGWRNFGDNWTEAYKSAGSANSINKIPQMTVSPDGRFAAFKLKSSTTYSRTELADETAILLISLTGKRVVAWGDEPYKIIGTGSDGSSDEGQYQFASSLTLTNGYLYYLIGSGSTTYLHFKDHYIYRYDLFGGDSEGAFLHPGFNSNWSNSTGSAMQTPFQMFARDYDLYTGPDPQMLSAHGHNAYESSLAPHPFRVSANGQACAIIAGQRTTSTTTGWEIRWNHIWVDYEGVFHQVSAQRRHHCGGGRGIQLSNGPTYSPCAYQWGHFDGPTSRFEISDDGLKVASVYQRYQNSSTYYPRGSSSYSDTLYRYRQDVVAYTTADAWQSRTIHEISGDATQNYQPSGEVFQDSIRWRFGALTFTAEGDGLVFWAGYSNYSPTRYMHVGPDMFDAAQAFVGSLYSYQFSDQAVKNILSSTFGGANKTVGATLTSISYSTSSWQIDGGVIKPIGGWISPNRHFLYIITKGALSSSTSYRRDGSMIGVNIRSLDTGRSINGRTDGRAYHPTWPDSQVGFYPIQYYIAAYGIGYYFYSSLYQQYYQSFGDGQRVAALDNGRVFFCGVKGTAFSSYASSSYGGCVHSTYYAYPYLDDHLMVFDQNVGGNIQQIIGDSWSGSTAYHTVGYIDVSDDGTMIAAVDSVGAYYDWNDEERLSVWHGIQLDSAGNLVGTPIRESYESGVFVGSSLSFSAKEDEIFYCAGLGNENMKRLYRGVLSGSSTKHDTGLSTRSYNVLHAGR